MNYYKFALMLVLMLVLAVGCSDKQEEAAGMERELSGQTHTMMPDTAPPMAVVDPAAAETIVTPQEEEFISSTPPGEGYTVQVAGCEDRAYAEFLVGRYTERGYEPYIQSASVEGQTFYRVRIGAFETLAEAAALRNQITDRYSVDAWIDYTQ